MRELALAMLLAVVGGGGGTSSGAVAKTAALPCASPHLPAAILAGANAAVSGSDVSAAPLAVVTVPASGGAPLTLAVASDGGSRELGLMCVTALRPGAGMLFVFNGDDEWSFWMKNTVISLDMIWVRGDGTITHVAPNVPASTLATPSERIARRSGFGTYVIELRSGGAAASHLTVGMRLAVPKTEAAR